MGELQHEVFQFTFNGFLKVAFQGSRVTSDAGLILVRELDERLGLATLISEHLSDSRHGLNTQFSLADLLRQSLYSRLAGYEDLNDAVRVSADPTFRLIGSPKRWDRGAALTSTLHWFETELLSQEENLVGLRAVNRELLAQAEMATRADRIVLDMDSSESPVHGAQEGSAYNGHFKSVCYHPLFLFTERGDCLAATLRPGNVHSAEDWDDLLLPEIDRQHAAGKRVAFRADAAFAKPEIYDALEKRAVDYVIRMPANKSLELEIEDILFRPPGRPSGKPLVRYKSAHHQRLRHRTSSRFVRAMSVEGRGREQGAAPPNDTRRGVNDRDGTGGVRIRRGDARVGPALLAREPQGALRDREVDTGPAPRHPAEEVGPAQFHAGPVDEGALELHPWLPWCPLWSVPTPRMVSPAAWPYACPAACAAVIRSRTCSQLSPVSCAWGFMKPLSLPTSSSPFSLSQNLNSPGSPEMWFRAHPHGR